MRLELGIPNFLDLSGLPGRPERRTYQDLDPSNLRENLGVPALSTALFPFLRVGVRAWPYLLFVRDHEGEPFSYLKPELKRIRRAHGGPMFGPISHVVYRAYETMYRDLRNAARSEPAARALVQFLGRLSSYEGGTAHFERHNDRWCSLLKRACGREGREFAKTIDLVFNEQSSGAHLEDTITWVLSAPRSKKLSPILLQGAVAYAALRCIYGVRDDGKAASVKQAPEWIRLASDHIKRMRVTVSAREKILKLLSDSRDAPALGWITEKAKDRMILSGLRFRVFYNLYYRPWPVNPER